MNKMMPASSMLLLLLLLTTMVTRGGEALDINISEVLSNYPQFTTFNTLLQRTGVVNEIQERSSLTILVAEDSVLDPVISSISQSITGRELADILRYHVLLEYESIKNLRHLQNRAKVFTTLFQTTGRAARSSGSVKVSDMNDGSVGVGWTWQPAVFGSEVLSGVREFPYNVSIVEISRVMVPHGVLSPSLMPTFLAPAASSPASTSEGPAPAPSDGASDDSSPGTVPAAEPPIESVDAPENDQSAAASLAYSIILLLLNVIMTV